MSTSSDQQPDAKEPTRRFQFGLRQLLGATVVFCIAAAIVAWRDPRMVYVPETFALIAFSVTGWGILTRRPPLILAGLLLIVAFSVRFWTNDPRPSASKYWHTMRDSVSVQVVDSSSKPIAGAMVVLDSKLGGLRDIADLPTDKQGCTVVRCYYEVYSRYYDEAGPYKYNPKDTRGIGEVLVTAGGYEPARLSIKLPYKQTLVVQMSK